MRVASLITTALLLIITAPLAQHADAQLIGESLEDPQPLQTRGYVSIGARVAQPLEDFAEYIDAGYGFGGYLAHALDDRGIISIRANADMLWYGHETTRHDLSTGWGGSLELTTSNNIFSMGIGPYITVPSRSVHPFLTGSIGFSYFSTTTSLQWRNSDETLDNWTDFDDAVMAWTAGGGLLIPISRGQRPVLLELSAIYHGNGEAEYLREGSISRDDDGDPLFTPIRSRTNLMLYTVGVSFGAW